ncbi:MAG: hypothetical protein U1E73_01460 [Planctomycetota bacterium]
MRSSTLLPLFLCATSLAAQNAFSDEQRTELRKIIREEIQAAMKDLHGTGGGMWTMSSPGEFKFKGEAAKAKPQQFTFHIDGNDKVGAAKGQVVELLDVTDEAPKTAKKAKAVKTMALQLDGDHVVKLGDGEAKAFVLGDGGTGLHELKLGDLKLECCDVKGEKGEDVVIDLGDGGALQLAEGHPMKLDLGQLLGGKSIAVALEGAKECCEHECAENCSEGDAKTEKAECCEGGEKGECCEDDEQAEKAAKKAAKKAKKAKGKKAKKGAEGKAVEIAIEGEFPVEIKKALESALREIH